MKLIYISYIFITLITLMQQMFTSTFYGYILYLDWKGEDNIEIRLNLLPNPTSFTVLDIAYMFSTLRSCLK